MEPGKGEMRQSLAVGMRLLRRSFLTPRNDRKNVIANQLGAECGNLSPILRVRPYG